MENNQLNLALQSLCRFAMMTEKNYPDVVIDLESKILDQRILCLSDEEINFLENNFSIMYINYLSKMENEDLILKKIIDKKIKKSN